MKLYTWHHDFYQKAPAKFTRIVAVHLCKEMGLPDRWFDCAVRNPLFASEKNNPEVKPLFKRVSHGRYVKN